MVAIRLGAFPPEFPRDDGLVDISESYILILRLSLRATASRWWDQ